MDLKYKTYPKKYGFDIEVDYNNYFLGFYWEAISFDQKEIGEVHNDLLDKKKRFFIETSFSPEIINIYPIRAASKIIKIDHCLLYPGKWKLQFINLFSSLGTIDIFGSKQDSYEEIPLVSSVNLSESKTVDLEFKFSCVLEKLLIKKSNFSNEKIILSNFSLKNNNEVYISDESLIKPEHQNVIRKNNQVIFEEKTKTWSFFSIMFYKI